MRAWTWMCLCGVILLGGCGGGDESLDGFRQRWSDAVNHRRSDDLYAMLDTASRRQLRHDLEVMRGLPQAQQQEAIDQLGGERVKNLTELTAERYFALLWDRIMQGKRPTLAIEAAGGDSAYVVLSLDGEAQQRFRLIKEGGRWAWVLPEQRAVAGTATAPASR